jgi:hypothetical protein
MRNTDHCISVQAMSHLNNFGYRILFPTETDLCLGAGNASSEEGQVHLQAPNTGGEQHTAGLASTPGLQFSDSLRKTVFETNFEIFFNKPQSDWVRISNATTTNTVTAFIAIYGPMICTFPYVLLSKSITRASGRGLGPGNRDFFLGPVK